MLKKERKKTKWDVCLTYLEPLNVFHPRRLARGNTRVEEGGRHAAKTSNLFSTNLNSAYLTPSACAVMLVPCAWLLAAMIRNVPNRRTSRCCNMRLVVVTTWGLERDLWIDGQRPNEPADSLKQIIRFLLFFALTCLHPLHRISDVDGVKEGRLILGTKDPARDLARRFCTKSIFCTKSYVFAQFIIQYNLFCMEDSAEKSNYLS